MIKAVVFDCFGVLLLDVHQSIAEKYPHKKLELADLEKQANAGFLSSAEYLTQVSEAVNLPESDVQKYFLSEHQLNTALLATIKNLKRSGYKIGMLSNLGRGWIEKYLDEATRSLFDEIVISGDVGMYKPYPEIYELLYQRLNLRPAEVFFVDDRLENVEAAKMIGMEAVQFTENIKLERDFTLSSINIH